MLNKLTLAQVAKMARAKDAAAWDALTPAQRQKMVADLNAGAYQAGRRAGMQEIEIDKRVIAAFMERHPEVPRSEVIQITPHIIAWAIREHSGWFWKGCYRPYVDPRREPVLDPATGHLMPGPLPPGARDSY